MVSGIPVDLVEDVSARKTWKTEMAFAQVWELILIGLSLFLLVSSLEYIFIIITIIIVIVIVIIIIIIYSVIIIILLLLY